MFRLNKNPYLALIALIALPSASTALIVLPASGEHNNHQVDPVHAPFLFNVGYFPNKSSAPTSLVYIGQKRVITAWHAFIGRSTNRVWIDNELHDFDPKSFRRLGSQSIANQSPDTDLVIFELRKDIPNLPNLILCDQTPFVGERVIMIGFGSRGKNERKDKVIPTWGENRIEATNLSIETNGSRIQAFSTTFDRSDLNMEAQAASGDSGGAVFVQRGNKWQLAGLMHSTSRPTQEGAVDFGARTYAIDLAAYRAQLNLPIPEPSSFLLLSMSLLPLFRRRR
jgi:hypothetical protein